MIATWHSCAIMHAQNWHAPCMQCMRASMHILVHVILLYHPHLCQTWWLCVLAYRCHTALDKGQRMRHRYSKCHQTRLVKYIIKRNNQFHWITHRHLTLTSSFNVLNMHENNIHWRVYQSWLNVRHASFNNTVNNDCLPTSWLAANARAKSCVRESPPHKQSRSYNMQWSTNFLEHLCCCTEAMHEALHEGAVNHIALSTTERDTKIWVSRFLRMHRPPAELIQSH